jgi:hypothetical protein
LGRLAGRDFAGVDLGTMVEWELAPDAPTIGVVESVAGPSSPLTNELKSSPQFINVEVGEETLAWDGSATAVPWAYNVNPALSPFGSTLESMEL